MKCSVADCQKDTFCKGWCRRHYYADRKIKGPVVWGSVLDRAMQKVDASGPCWLWTGAGTQNGYGNIRVKGKTHLAHRVVWEELVGPIPDGRVIDHLCKVRSCVNPDHMEIVTQRENVLRGKAGLRGVRRATHCLRGHPFTPDNTLVSPSGESRQCRTCKRLRARKDWADRTDVVRRPRV